MPEQTGEELEKYLADVLAKMDKVLKELSDINDKLPEEREVI